MKKRHILYFALLLILCGGVYEVYQYYIPENNTNIESNQITYNFDKVYTLEEYSKYLLSQSEDFNVIFFTDNDINSQYLFNTILPTIISDNNIHSFNNLIYVKTDNIEDVNPNTYNSKYGFSSVPALVHVQYSETQYQIVDVLQFNSTKTLSYDNVNEFLKKYEIY